MMLSVRVIDRRLIWLVCVMGVFATLMLVPGQLKDPVEDWFYLWWPWSRTNQVLAADRIVHLVAFAGMFCLLAAQFKSRLMLGALLCAVAGFSEIAQIWVPGRAASSGDFVLDLAGIGCGALLLAFIGESQIRQSGR